MTRLRRALAPLLLALLAGCAPESAPLARSPAVPSPTPVLSQPSPIQPSPTPGPRSGPASSAHLRFAVTDEQGFTRRGPAGSGDWLAVNEERGQTFDDYTDDDPVGATATRRVLAFMPVGDFDDGAWETARAAETFAGIWFAMPTRMLAGAELARPDDFYRERSTAAGEPIRQYRTGWFLRRLLPRHLPEDAVCLVGVTMVDLFPGPDWNYVFGEADLRRRIGVYSLVRYFPEFWGEESTAAARTVALRRTLKLVVHEIGHTFGVEHCVFFECNMAGSNSLAETDRSPLHLCPVCLRKLQWNREVDVLDRYRELLGFYRRHGLDEEAEWTARRITRIEAAGEVANDGQHKTR